MPLKYTAKNILAVFQLHKDLKGAEKRPRKDECVGAFFLLSLKSGVKKVCEVTSKNTQTRSCSYKGTSSACRLPEPKTVEKIFERQHARSQKKRSPTERITLRARPRGPDFLHRKCRMSFLYRARNMPGEGRFKSQLGLDLNKDYELLLPWSVQTCLHSHFKPSTGCYDRYLLQLTASLKTPIFFILGTAV